MKEYWISNNDGGMKSIAFPLIGKKNVTVDGQGAKLVFHESLIVENNYFRTNGKRFLDVAHVGNVVFRNNTFCQDDSLYGGQTLGEDGFDLRECGNVENEKI